jgi:hypothetical protein
MLTLKALKDCTDTLCETEIALLGILECICCSRTLCIVMFSCLLQWSSFCLLQRAPNVLVLRNVHLVGHTDMMTQGFD